MKLLNGKELANKIKENLKEEIKNRKVCLTVVQVGDNTASSIYVRNKEKACECIGIISRIIKVEKDISEKELIAIVQKLNNDDNVNGILVQLPLPNHINESAIIKTISPEKDVDGFHESNMGKLFLGEETFIPCTAKGIIRLLEENNIEIQGKHCVVVGRSAIVGKPTAIELLRKNGTVTICHSKTENLKEICKSADILVCAIGKPKFFNREYIKTGAIVIDVGIHRQDGTFCGDVDFDDVKDLVKAITPVPGGVGPMTVAMLMENTVRGME